MTGQLGEIKVIYTLECEAFPLWIQLSGSLAVNYHTNGRICGGTIQQMTHKHTEQRKEWRYRTYYPVHTG